MQLSTPRARSDDAFRPGCEARAEVGGIRRRPERADAQLIEPHQLAGVGLAVAVDVAPNLHAHRFGAAELRARDDAVSVGVEVRVELLIAVREALGAVV